MPYPSFSVAAIRDDIDDIVYSQTSGLVLLDLCRQKFGSVPTDALSEAMGHDVTSHNDPGLDVAGWIQWRRACIRSNNFRLNKAQ